MLRLTVAGGSALALTTAFLALSLGQKPPPPPPGPPPSPPPPAAPAPGGPYAGLNPQQVTRFQAGLIGFTATETPPTGLGPVFTENACVKCHNGTAIGGSSNRLVTRIGRMLNGQYDPLVAFGGPVIQNNGIGRFNGVNFVGEVVPPQATIVAQRRPTQLFGLGLIDAVPDSTLIALAEAQADAFPQTAGRVSPTVDPATGQARAGRFGWKAQEPTLLAFSGDAYVNELGVTTPLFPTENCPQGNCNLLAANPAKTNPNELDDDDIQGFADFITLLAPPPRGPVGPNEMAGQAIFNQIGCASCHQPSLQTGPSPVGPLNHVAFSPYSDFLLHNMGSLGDGIGQGQAGQQEMRTAPLWGLRFQTSLLHDGRTTSIPQAILFHAGQAQPSRNAFNSLSVNQQNLLVAFLKSL